MVIAGLLQRYIKAFLTFITYRWFTRMSFTAKVSFILNLLIFALFVSLVFIGEKHERARQAGRELAKGVECLSLNIYHEARGEPLVGQIAVGLNVVNRVRSKYYPNTVCEVVYQPWQYSWTMEPKLRSVPFEHVKKQRPDIVLLAREVLEGKYPDVTGGSTHYFASRLHNNNKAPAWRKSMEPKGRIGAHEHYCSPQVRACK